MEGRDPRSFSPERRKKKREVEKSIKGESLEALIGWLDPRFELNCWLPLVPGVIEAETQTAIRDEDSRDDGDDDEQRGTGAGGNEWDGDESRTETSTRKDMQHPCSNSNGVADPTSEKSAD
jgi:hypothetical protein